MTRGDRMRDVCCKDLEKEERNRKLRRKNWRQCLHGREYKLKESEKNSKCIELKRQNRVTLEIGLV